MFFIFSIELVNPSTPSLTGVLSPCFLLRVSEAFFEKKMRIDNARISDADGKQVFYLPAEALIADAVDKEDIYQDQASGKK